MNTFNKLDFLRGYLNLRVDEIDVSTWVKLVFDCISDCKPHLHYLPGQHSIKELTNGMVTANIRRITPEDEVFLPKGITLSTKCLEIIKLKSENNPDEPISGLNQPERRLSIEKTILLSCTGELLLWTASHKSSRYNSTGVQHQQETDEQIESAIFTRVSRRGLKLIISKERRTGHFIISTLKNLFEKGIENREKNLLSMKETLHEISEMLRKIL